MILFTADWHIKLGQKNVPKHWAYARYYKFFEQINKLEKVVDMHIIGGDIFDRLPSMEELELYFTFVASCNIQTLIYDGNHEATKKNQTFMTFLKEATTKVNDLVQIIDKSVTINDPGFHILPYCQLHKKDSIEYFTENLPLFTHVRGEIPPHVKPEIDLARLSRFPIVIAGDLHAHSNTQKNIVYPGSPMTTSFHRNEVETGFLLIDPDNWEWTWNKFELPQLLRKTVQSVDQMIPTTYHHTIYELEGDVQDLASVNNSELLDKKIVKRSSEATLIIDKDMSILDELAEYLKYILELDSNKVDNILHTFNEYSI